MSDPVASGASREPFDIVSDYKNKTCSDILLFSAAITDDNVRKLIVMNRARASRRKRACLLLTTLGGNPHEAYRLARYLRRTYQPLRVIIAGPCKSAGTLVAIGADELALGPLGELGPLDIQIPKMDEMVRRNSGLDIYNALTVLSAQAQTIFRGFVTDLVQEGGGLSTKTAAEIASSLTTQLLNPIAAQIDPIRLGETQRQLEIARAYGERLCNRGAGTKRSNLKEDALSRLIEGYPSHSFIIDSEEAKDLFTKIDQLSELETELIEKFDFVLARERGDQTIFDLSGVTDTIDEAKKDEQ